MMVFWIIVRKGSLLLKIVGTQEENREPARKVVVKPGLNSKLANLKGREA
jgi:hypothetical protein